VDRAQLVLTVADHGPGLPTATAGRAFDAFTQLKRIEVDAYGGVGLGLSVSQGLVAAMSGAIHHQPTAGGGATFVVRLPFKPHPAPRPGI
jgi:two-component system OmpR family sensor kinase